MSVELNYGKIKNEFQKFSNYCLGIEIPFDIFSYTKDRKVVWVW